MERIPLHLPGIDAALWRTAAPADTLLTVITPFPIDFSRLPVYKKDRAAVLALSGMDWDALTPWPAPPLREGDAPFPGGADTFLARLLSSYLPAAESAAGVHPVCRALLGVSLAGLFALWSVCRTDAFAAAASLSGSFWYDGFMEWLRRHPPRAARVYLGLGRKESAAAHPRLAAIGRATEETAALLRAEGAAVTLDIFPGGHRQPPERFAHAVRWFLDGQ